MTLTFTEKDLDRITGFQNSERNFGYPEILPKVLFGLDTNLKVADRDPLIGRDLCCFFAD